MHAQVVVGISDCFRKVKWFGRASVLTWCEGGCNCNEPRDATGTEAAANAVACGGWGVGGSSREGRQQLWGHFCWGGRSLLPEEQAAELKHYLLGVKNSNPLRAEAVHRHALWDTSWLCPYLMSAFLCPAQCGDFPCPSNLAFPTDNFDRRPGLGPFVAAWGGLCMGVSSGVWTLTGREAYFTNILQIFVFSALPCFARPDYVVCVNGEIVATFCNTTWMWAMGLARLVSICFGWAMPLSVSRWKAQHRGSNSIQTKHTASVCLEGGVKERPRQGFRLWQPDKVQPNPYSSRWPRRLSAGSGLILPVTGSCLLPAHCWFSVPTCLGQAQSLCEKTWQIWLIQRENFLVSRSQIALTSL